MLRHEIPIRREHYVQTAAGELRHIPAKLRMERRPSVDVQKLLERPEWDRSVFEEILGTAVVDDVHVVISVDEQRRDAGNPVEKAFDRARVERREELGRDELVVRDDTHGIPVHPRRNL